MSGNNLKRKTPHLLRGQKQDKVGLTPKKGAGFTLMEILVALSIFSLLVVVIINVFLLALSSQRQASFRQKTLASLRFATETIAQQIRTSEIDYSYYGGQIPTTPTNALALIDQNGRKIRYTLASSGINLEIITDGISEKDLLTSDEEVAVLDLDFYIAPLTSPFIEERCNEDSDCQPDSLGCNILAKICQGGDNQGKICASSIDCPGSICISPSFKEGFCRCGNNDQCLTNYCSAESLCLSPEVQPRVTMVLGFQSKGVKPEDIKTIYFQTTVSSRVYKR